MEVIIPAAFFIATAVVSALGTGVAVRYLRQKSFLDVPNERSSHSAPTPKGGGIAMVPAILVAWLVFAAFQSSSAIAGDILWVIAGATVLAAVSWFDDLKGLSPAVRLLAQFLVVGTIVIGTPSVGLVFQGLLPPWLDRAVVIIIWVGFANIFNFMDGIDAISGIESLAVGLGVSLVVFAAKGPIGTVIIAAAIAGGGLGFLRWNWPPAKIFLGDVGSVPLGFLLGWLLLDLAASGYWAAAIVIPLYYLADSCITLARRIFRGEKFWEAHKEHYYQRAVAMGRSHGQVSIIIGISNLGLIAFALVSIKDPATGIVAGAFTAFVTLLILKRKPD